MRILVVASVFPTTQQPDAGIFVLKQTRALADRGYELLVLRVVPSAPPLNERWRRYREVPDSDVIDGIRVRTLRAVFPPRMFALEYLDLQVNRQIAKVISDFRPALLQAHFLLPAGQLAVRQRIPAVVTAHGSDAYEWPWQRSGLRRAATEAVRKAEAVVAVSSFIGRYVEKLVPRDYRVIFNGADEKVFAPADRGAARAALGIASDRFVVAFAGRLSVEKGVIDLLRAAESLVAMKPLLLLAGEEQKSIAQARASLHVEARTFGTVSHGRLSQIFAAANIFVLPSYGEGLPVALCEALLSGRPVIATTVGGIPEIVQEGVSGYLLAPGDIRGLANRLARAAQNPEQSYRMGRAAHEFARRHLTWSANAASYDELYRSIVETARDA